ncbi:hypothetical protein M2272_005974 [Mycobacterium frederiksbergense]|uniref:Intersectin-EH binding protein Ibp1 n=1 Tax=Mycolicibacterium frederiksbergense TaxID=117567 RepID=A0ABT6L8M4_9MYCO|nr:hypothetical protein [Mycolicibacterium frederiksbergense]MDH6199304.1 hypothetical protein [Mycolicibacterium frederiksbergense]
MKFHRLALLALTAAGIAATVLTAPAAAADPECIDVGGGATRCSSPGNVQINATPTQQGPYLPYGCDPAYAALCYDNIPGIAIDIGGGDRPNGGGGGLRPRFR